jgi:FAD/FMN-containing dehydrogenase
MRKSIAPQVTIEDPEYEARRSGVLWNARIPNRRPAVIFAPASREEAREAVRVALSEGHMLAIKSGGHSWIGSPLRDGGALIDLSALSSISVDVDRRVALVEPGATHKELADQVVPLRLAFPIGHCPSVGLGGYLLAGGFGWNPGTWGPACWSVQAIEVTTADGRSFISDSDHHPELFWAARGGGPGFPGIVTRFDLQLQALPKIVSHRAAYSLSALPELAEWTASTIPGLPAGVEISLIARRVTEHDEPRVTLSATAFGQTVGEASAVLGILEDAPCADLAIDYPQREEVLMTELQGEGGWARGLRYAVDGCHYALGAVAEVAARIEHDLRAAPSKLTRIIMVFTPVPQGAPDVALTRLGDADISTYATWERPEDDEVNVQWLRDHMAGLGLWATGYYSGESDLLAEPNRAKKCFTAANWERLRAVKAEYDPHGRFFDYPGLAG